MLATGVADGWDTGHDCPRIPGYLGRQNLFPDIREMCEFCSGGGGTPTGGHSHRIINQDGTLGAHEPVRVGADWYGNEQQACIITGGGGYMERIGRIIAFRDYAKRSIQENPRGFTLTFPDLARSANKYAYIVRKFKRHIPLTADEQRIIDRCNAIIRIKDANEADYRRTGRIVDFVWPANEAILPPAPARPDRATIEAQIRREMGGEIAPPIDPLVALAAQRSAAGVPAVRAAAGVPAVRPLEDGPMARGRRVRAALLLERQGQPLPLAAVPPLAAALPPQIQAQAAAHPAAVAAAADVAAVAAAQGSGVVEQVWNYFFNFLANPAAIAGGVRTRHNRKRSLRKTRQIR